MKYQFDDNYHSTAIHSGAGVAEYVRHNVDVYTNWHGNSIVFQTGCSYKAGDYSCPTDYLELSYDGGTDRVFTEWYLDELEADGIEVLFADGTSMPVCDVRKAIEEIESQADQHFENMKLREGWSDDPDDWEQCTIDDFQMVMKG
jgi:hypothetical protein